MYHFYTTSVAELTNLVNNEGNWSLEGVAYYAYAIDQTPVLKKIFPELQLIKLHRLNNPDSGDHLYTIWDTEVQSAQNIGYQCEGSAAWVFPVDALDEYHSLVNPKEESTLRTAPLFRLYRTSTLTALH
jgi:Repeat of unknown function (DUF5648)